MSIFISKILSQIVFICDIYYPHHKLDGSPGLFGVERASANPTLTFF